MNDNLGFCTLKMDSLAEKMTARDVYFSAQGVQDLFPDPLMSQHYAPMYPNVPIYFPVPTSNGLKIIYLC